VFEEEKFSRTIAIAMTPVVIYNSILSYVCFTQDNLNMQTYDISSLVLNLDQAEKHIVKLNIFQLKV
jgi:hypothetical protein